MARVTKNIDMLITRITIATAMVDDTPEATTLNYKYIILFTNFIKIKYHDDDLWAHM